MPRLDSNGRYSKPKHFLSKGNGGRPRLRRLLVESLENRSLLAADPSLVFDLNSQPDPSLGSAQVAWPSDLVDSNLVNHFLADSGGVTQWWATDGTTAGTEKIRDLDTLDDPSIFQAFGQAFVHTSSSLAGTTVYWTNRYTPIKELHLPFETLYLGAVYPKVIVQELSTNDVYAIDLFDDRATIVASFASPGVPVVQTLSYLYVDVDNPAAGGLERWSFRGPFSLSVETSSPIQTTDQFFADEPMIWNSDPSGTVSQTSNGLGFSRTLAFLGSTPNDMELVNQTVFSSQYDAISNVSTIRRLNSFDTGSQVIATLNGRAQLSEASFRLLVQVEGGSDAGYWWENTEQDGLDFDPAMSVFVGPVHAIGNTVLGWGEAPGVGSELLSYLPDPAMQLGTRNVSENQFPGFNFSNVFMAIGENSGTTYELVRGPGDTNNALFSLSPQGAIAILDTLNFEAQSKLSLRIRASGAFGVLESPFLVYVADLKEEVKITNDRVAENAVVGQVVGTLNTLNTLPGRAIQYSIQSIDFDPALDGLFGVSGDQLIVQGTLDFEQKSSYTVSIRATTDQGENIDSLLTIYIDNINENNQSAITISNDQILENNAIGIVVGTLGVRSDAGVFTYTLEAGPGDYDNGLFTIQGNELIFNESANIESRTNYSVRVSASNGSATISGAITIDILAVDEFATDGIDFVLPGGSVTGFFSIVENTPVGTHVLSLFARDLDLDTYTWSISGSFAQYFRIEGNQMIVNSPINFEAIPDIFGNNLSVTVTSNTSGNTFTRSQPGVDFPNSNFSVPSVYDINDAPVVSAISNQSIREGDIERFFLASPLVFDEDRDQPFPVVNLLLDGAPAPDWLRLDPNSFDLIVEADFGTAGEYTVTVEAVDLYGAIGTSSFQLTILTGTVTAVLGTPGNDVIDIRPRNNLPGEWVVRVNGAIVFSGLNSQVSPLLFDGLGGTDSVNFQGTPTGNLFSLGSQRLTIDGSRFYLRGIETEVVRGTGGNDQFQLEPSVYPPPPTGRSSGAVLSSSILLDGGSGQDTVLGAAIDTNWEILRRNEGTVAGIGFTNVERLIGNQANDTFTISRRGSISGRIDGGTGGLDSIQYSTDFGDVRTQLNSLVDLRGDSSGIGEFFNIDLINAPDTSRNVLTYGRALAQSNIPMIWSLFVNAVQLSDNSPGAATFQTAGYGVLEGTNRADQFDVFQSNGQTRILGGGGENTISYENMFDTVELNLSTASGTSITSFRDIQRFIGSQIDSVVYGRNVPTNWTIVDDATSLSTGESLLRFKRMIGGTAEDQFTFLNQPEFSSAYVIDAGLGRNSLDFSKNGYGVYVDLLSGFGTTLSSVFGISDIYGSEFNDVFIGDDQNNLLFGMGGDDNLQGLAGNDALFGGSGSDTLDGGDGLDWLVGGSDSDFLNGGDGEDILVAGRAPGFEQENFKNINAFRLSRIDAVMAEWTSNRSYSQRIQRLQNGVGAGNAARLNSSTLRDDQVEDSLQGNGGDDWFFASPSDTLLDRRNAERWTILV